MVDTDPDCGRDGMIADEAPLLNVADEFDRFRWNRCSSACHGPTQALDVRLESGESVRANFG